MQIAPIPKDEFLRLQVLYSLNILDTQPDERFDCITRFACQHLSIPICLVSLVDAKRQWFKSVQGLEISETPRASSFCAHAILNAGVRIKSSRIFEIPDTYQDLRFSDNPLVIGEPWVRFYIGYVLCSTGKNIGTLCLIDTEPRRFTYSEKDLLITLGSMVENIISGRPHTIGVEDKLN